MSDRARLVIAAAIVVAAILWTAYWSFECRRRYPAMHELAGRLNWPAPTLYVYCGEEP